MPRRFASALLIISILVFLILFGGTFFAESIAYIGVYEFFSTFSQLVDRTWKPLLVGSILFSFLRTFFYEGYFLAGLSGPGIRSWFFAFVLGILEPPFSFSVISRMASLYRSGVHMGAIFVYSLSSVFFSFPLVVLLYGIWSMDIMKWYGILGLMSLIFFGAMGELVSGFRLVAPFILARRNPSKPIVLISFSYIQSLRFKGYLSLVLSRFSEFWKYSFPSWVFGLCILGLMQAAFSNETLQMFLGNDLLGQIGVLILSMILPLYGIAGLVVGVHSVDLYSGLGTLMMLMFASFFWKCVFEAAPHKLYLKSWKISFLIILFVGMFLLGYVGNFLVS